MTRVDGKGIGKDKELLPYRANKGIPRATGKIGSSHPAGKQGIPGKHPIIEEEGYSTRCMARGVNDPKGEGAHLYLIPFRKEPIRRR